MSSIPIPRSRSQILGSMIASFCDTHQIPALKIGGPILSILTAAADSDFRDSADIFQALDAIDLDSATGTALAAWGAREGVPQGPLVSATGSVNIGDAAFQKISSIIFAGTPAPIVGSINLDVVDASEFPSFGAVYVGRGTSRYEGPINYSSTVDNGTYWSLTLTSPTLRFHNQGDSVILSQGGDRTVQAGAVVRSPRSSLSDTVDFKLQFAATIPDGEVTLTGVGVTAIQPGSQGNAPASAIREWASPPWPQATVTNPLRYNNGTDVEEEDSWKERIRHARANRALGIAPALEAAAIGVVSPDEGRRVLSAAYVPRKGVPSILVIDDGTGYEERTAGIAIERLLESSAGGEFDLALQSTPVAKAILRTDNNAPYKMAPGAQLVMLVGGQASAHIFDPSSFANPNSATSFEVVSSINSDPDLLYSARTVDGGAGFVVTARAEENDDIEVSAPLEGQGVDANLVFSLPAGVARTVLLFHNDRPLSKDGRPAVVEGLPVGGWDPVSGPQTITLSVDNTPAQTYTITDQDFVNAGTGFLAVGRNTPAAWVSVLKARLPGVTASTDGTRIDLTSNLGSNARAAVEVLGGTLVAVRMFSVSSAVGLGRDFSLSRPRGLIRLESPAAAGDIYSAGTTAPRAFLESTDLASVTLASDAHLWVAADSDATLVPHGITSSTPVAIIAQSTHDWGARVRVEAFPGTTPTASIFDEVLPGDWAVLWDPAFPSSAKGAWRVVEVGTVTVGPDTFSTRLILELSVARAARAGHGIVTLNPISTAPSKVLICGGWTSPSTSLAIPVSVTNSVEIFDYATLTWTSVTPMATARAYHSTTTLVDGRVLVVGGVDQSGNALATAELYDPITNTWATAASYQVQVSRHRAVLLSDGRVMVAGGVSGSAYRTQAAIYDPGTNSWTINIPMTTARARFGAVLLADGRVLVAGGETTGAVATAFSELLNPVIPSWSAAATMPTSRRAHGLAGVGSPITTVIAIGDDRGGPRTGSRTVYTVGSNTWAADIALPGGAVYESKDAITLQSGNVLALLGRIGTTPWSAEWNGAAWTTITNPFYADSASRQEVGLALLRNNAATLLGKVLTLGGLDPTRTQPTATAEIYDRVSNTWSVPDSVIASGLFLTQIGLSIARTPRFLQDITIPAGTGYTATSLASAIVGQGFVAETYRTNRLRLRTTSHGVGGNILLAAVDSSLLGLTPGVETNEVEFVAAVKSDSEIGTPDFISAHITEEGLGIGLGVAGLVGLDRTTFDAGDSLVLARNHDDGLLATPNARQGRSSGFYTTAVSVTTEPQSVKLTLRALPDGGLTAGDRVWAAAPYALAPNDTLAVAVDNTSTFSPHLFRRTTPSGSYATQITLTDADNGGATLAAAFGLTFNFDDFYVYMKARGVLFGSDVTRATMARYYLHGPAGNRVRVRVSYPLAPNAVASVVIDALTNLTTDVRLRLPGGAARSLAGIRSSTRIGVAVTGFPGGLGSVVYVVNLPVASAIRDGSDISTLTLDLPASVADHGILVGDILFFNSSDPGWNPGNISVTARTPTTITFNNPALGSGAYGPVSNIGTISADAQGEATFQGAGIVADDLLRVNSASGLASSYTGETFRVTSATAGRVATVATGKVFGATSTTLIWALLGTASYLEIWAPTAPTANAFAASINALAAADNTTNPISLQALGSGVGTLTRATVEDLGDANGWVTLVDGLNHVGRTILPTVLTDQYSFVLKTPVDPVLAAAAGWSSEDVRLVPSTAYNVSNWLNAPAVSGIFTAAEVARTDSGQTVQIATLTSGSGGSVQVQGGDGNTATAIVRGASTDVGTETVIRVPANAVAPLAAAGWVEAYNTIPAERLGVLTGSSVLQSWNAQGYLTLSSTTLWTQRFLNSNVRIHIERQGRYLALSDPAGSNVDSTVTLTGLLEGDYIEITAAGTPTSFHQVSTSNLGIYRVVRVAPSEQLGVGGTVWIENSLGIEETAEMTLRGIAFDSVLPGDTLQISHDLWGHANRGTWTIEAVGVTVGTVAPLFQNTTVMKVSVAEKAPTLVTAPAISLGANSSLTIVAEGAPGKLLKRIITITPDPTDGSLALVRLDTNTYSRLISSLRGTVLYAMDKLGFTTDRVIGTDGYRASVGLVGQVNRVIQGDPSDQTVYPGVLAAGPQLLVQAPSIKRLFFALLVRATSGFNRDDLAARIREAVISEVNKVGVGQAVALSMVVQSAQSIQGVTAVVILSPPYDSAHDVVSVSREEKPLVLSTDDVTVTFLSE